MEKLRLVRPEKKYEQQAKAYIEEFKACGSKIHGVGGLTQYLDDYDGWLEKLAADRVRVPDEGHVPAETYFLVKEVPAPSKFDGMPFGTEDRIVGMVNIRLALNESQWVYGGSIGYSIRPSERRKGYNKVNLYLALKVCQNRGIEVALLDCEQDNIGSAKTIRALGGKMVREWPHLDDDGKTVTMQWYTIDVDAALEKYATQYDQFVSVYPD